MFSKILIKLIDQAILPAIVLIAARILSVFFIARFGGMDFTLGAQGFIYQDTDDYIFVNSYSTLAMVVILSMGLGYILLKSLVFHESHITPALTAKLFSLRMSHFIQSSYDLYSQGAIWLSYLFFMTAASAIMGFSGIMYVWVFWVSLIVSISLTAIFILDIENEMALKNSTAIEDSEEFVLELGGFDE